MSDTSPTKLTVRDALAIKGVQEWVVDVWANDGLDRRVRWAQCLDPFVMSRVVAEGDLVVASASIDVGVEQPILADMVESLGHRGVVALCLSVEAATMPESVHEVGRHHRMAVVALGTGSPSFALVEQMNRAIAVHEMSELRVLDEVNRVLNETLAGGLGLRGLIESAARLAGGGVVLLTPLGRVVAIAGFGAHQDLIELVEGDDSMSADVELDGRLWGTVVVGSVSPGAEAVSWALLQRLPMAIAIEVMRFSESVPADERARRELVIDLLVGNIRSESEFVLRASFSELQLQPGDLLVGLAMPLAPGIRSPVTRALRTLAVQSLEAELDTNLLILINLAQSTGADEVVRRLVEALPQHLVTTEAIPKPLVAVGPVVGDLSEVGRSLHEARDTLTLARHIGTQLSIVTAEHFGVDRLLSRLLDDPELMRFSDNLLEPLTTYDSNTNGQLVHTLERYLRNGMSKTRTASDLHLRRQSLYGRLKRIEQLIGSLEDPDFCLALQVALKAHRLINTPARPRRAESWWRTSSRQW